jgi:hypothetical protein
MAIPAMALDTGSIEDPSIGIASTAMQKVSRGMVGTC